MKEIIIATRNEGKAQEFEEFFASYHIRTNSLLDFTELPDIEETGETFKENARLKAETLMPILKAPILADDSGLMIDALGGKPGIKSARYAGEMKSDQANITKVLNHMSGIPMGDRGARFVCTLAIARPGKDTIFSTGYCEGLIATSQKGENGFGYDPIFIPKGSTKTMAELSADQKNQISHRKRAMIQLEDWLSNHLK